MDSILTSIKKLLGIPEEYENFDVDIIMHINSVFTILKQMGVGDNTFLISDKSSKWDDFLGDYEDLETIKSYTYLKVRKLFDPPTSSTVNSAMNEMINELEWRISVTVDPKND